MMVQQITPDKSGASVVLGILVAVLLVVGGFLFLKSQGIIETGGTTTASVEAVDGTINTTEPAAGEPAGNTPSPTPVQ